MDFSKSFFLILTLTASSFSFSQIVTKGQPVIVSEPAKDSVRPRRVATDGTNEFGFYIGASYVKANRYLRRNEAPFGKPLYERDNEVALNTWAYQLGIRNQINKWFAYDAALSLEKNGEAYSYKDAVSDSTYSYETTYKYVALPVQLYLTYGKDLRFFVGGGIQPELYAGYKKEIRYSTSTTNENTETIEKLDKPEAFLFGLIASAGIQYRIGRISSVYVIPGMLWNLNSSYTDQAEAIHKARNFNLKFGLIFHLPN